MRGLVLEWVKVVGLVVEWSGEASVVAVLVVKQ
jgi:hypothetical protein